MLSDNGWVLHYDMEIARAFSFRLSRLLQDSLSPEVLFDEGYATWLGVYPGDQADSRLEREGLLRLSKTDPRQYMSRMRLWATARMEMLREQGWRKAREG
jgi:hypothetical protein